MDLKMKKFQMILLLIMFSQRIIAQDFCTLNDPPDKSLSFPLFGNMGTLKVLVVLCKFSDDNYINPPETDLWPSTLNSMPSWGPSLVSTTVQPDYSDPSLSGYFQDMSTNRYQIIGDVKFYQPLYEQSHYFISNNRHIGYLSEEILLEINSQVNFADYDNWDPKDLDQDGNKNEPDGQVDFIAICFRDADFSQLDIQGYSGHAGLTGRQNTFGSGNQLNLDGKIISALNLSNGLGSGTVQRGVLEPHKGLEIMAHEMGHYMLGTKHFSGLGYHGLMDGMGNGIMSSVERSKMFWVLITTIYTDTPNNYLPDALSTSIVKRIKISNSEYFFIDNHQRINFYESSWKKYHNGPLRSPGTGVLIIHHLLPERVHIESSYGRWDWKKSNNIYVYPFEKEFSNRSFGENKLNLREKPTTAGIKNHPDYLGAPDDYLNPGFVQIFSPWSNPSTHEDTANICVELVAIDENKVARVNLYTQNAIFQAPSKPQNPKLSANPGNNYVRLSWEHNLETDKAYYEVSRKVYELGGIWQVIGTTTNNYFVDNEFYYSNPIGDFGCTYRLRVKDTQNKFSVYSDEVSIRAEMMGKIAVTDEGEREYNLDFNYPNPFNPTTVINFAVKDAGFVILKVYDILGSEVATLVNETKEAGNFAVEFNAANLPSGVYIYTLQVNGFTSSKKMLLMK